jgi:hypothetical protein
MLLCFKPPEQASATAGFVCHRLLGSKHTEIQAFCFDFHLSCFCLAQQIFLCALTFAASL